MLEGTLLKLRPLEEGDLPLIVKWRNERDIRRSFFHKSLLSVSGQRLWYDVYLQDRSREIFIAEKADDGFPVGMIGLNAIDLANRKAELGMTMIGDSSMRGKGLATEMIRMLLEYAFADLGLNRVYSFAIATNQGSIRAKLKCGFQLEGTLREEHYMDGRFEDVAILAVTRRDWRGLRQQAPSGELQQ